MHTASIAIVGGGLSGLYAAYLLEQKGIRDCVLLEARGVLGGRIVSASPSGHPAPGTAAAAEDIDRFDLGLKRFEQHETGDMVAERSSEELPMRMRGYVNSPALPQALARQWRATAIWMAPHAKYIAIYDTPFWREQGLSGEARSARGPLGEIHDASMPGGSAALFGFFGVPARVRKNVSEGEPYSIEEPIMKLKGKTALIISRMQDNKLSNAGTISRSFRRSPERCGKQLLLDMTVPGKRM